MRGSVQAGLLEKSSGQNISIIHVLAQKSSRELESANQGRALVARYLRDMSVGTNGYVFSPDKRRQPPVISGHPAPIVVRDSAIDSPAYRPAPFGPHARRSRPDVSRDLHHLIFAFREAKPPPSILLSLLLECHHHPANSNLFKTRQPSTSPNPVTPPLSFPHR